MHLRVKIVNESYYAFIVMQESPSLVGEIMFGEGILEIEPSYFLSGGIN